jgi:hypothetical protein
MPGRAPPTWFGSACVGGVTAVCCLVSREEFRFGEAVWAVQGRLLDGDVLAVTSAVTPVGAVSMPIQARLPRSGWSRCYQRAWTPIEPLRQAYPPR